jgi:UDP:flavonoid glycosyltransferase YjiC (YdhE family)
MRVLAACSLGGAGHLNPLLPLLAAARRRGAETSVVGPPAVRAMVERSGFRFVAGGEPPEDAVAPIRERLPVAPPHEASVLGNRELFGRLAACAMVPAIEEACSQWGPDLVLRDPCEYASAIVAPRHDVPTAQVAISLAEVEARSIDVAAPALDEHRPGLPDELRATPYLTRFPPSLDPSPFRTTVRFQAPEPPPPPRGPTRPAWWDRADVPFVYATLGTVLGHMTIAGDVYRTLLDAVAGLDVRVLLTVGRRFDATSLGRVPENVHVEAWVDQGQVLDQADLVVCHGGSGTVLGALAAGVPIVGVPLFADQFENARRIAAAGAGRSVTVTAEAGPSGGARQPIGAGDAPRISDAIEAVLADPAYRERADGIAAEMAAAPRADDVLDALLADSPRPRTR